MSPQAIDPELERRLAVIIHLGGIATGPLMALTAALVWGRPASRWLRRHIRDALVHWAIVVALFVGAYALDRMNPVYDFGLVAALPSYLGISRAYGILAWCASAVFAVLSARRAFQGKGSFYPLTLWWESPHQHAQTMELDR
ncbi:MAG: hypothetical protein QOI63_1884 [Thermoplasmata archaeon]|jgi:hypothetical protein|nr:hypothetical protein [Thermoplasmata archaeon]